MRYPHVSEDGLTIRDGLTERPWAPGEHKRSLSRDAAAIGEMLEDWFPCCLEHWLAYAYLSRVVADGAVLNGANIAILEAAYELRANTPERLALIPPAMWLQQDQIGPARLLDIQNRLRAAGYNIPYHDAGSGI